MLRYEAPRRRRIKKRFWGVTNFSGFWWFECVKKWVEPDSDLGNQIRKNGYGTHCHTVKSVRAFRRHLRKHSKYLPKGIEFTLVSYYKNHSVYGKTV